MWRKYKTVLLLCLIGLPASNGQSSQQVGPDQSYLEYISQARSQHQRASNTEPIWTSTYKSSSPVDASLPQWPSLHLEPSPTEAQLSSPSHGSRNAKPYWPLPANPQESPSQWPSQAKPQWPLSAERQKAPPNGESPPISPQSSSTSKSLGNSPGQNPSKLHNPPIEKLAPSPAGSDQPTVPVNETKNPGYSEPVEPAHGQLDVGPHPLPSVQPPTPSLPAGNAQPTKNSAPVQLTGPAKVNSSFETLPPVPAEPVGLYPSVKHSLPYQPIGSALPAKKFAPGPSVGSNAPAEPFPVPTATPPATAATSQYVPAIALTTPTAPPVPTAATTPPAPTGPTTSSADAATPAVDMAECRTAIAEMEELARGLTLGGPLNPDDVVAKAKLDVMRTMTEKEFCQSLACADCQGLSELSDDLVTMVEQDTTLTDSLIQSGLINFGSVAEIEQLLSTALPASKVLDIKNALKVPTYRVNIANGRIAFARNGTEMFPSFRLNSLQNIMLATKLQMASIVIEIVSFISHAIGIYTNFSHKDIHKAAIKTARLLRGALGRAVYALQRTWRSTSSLWKRSWAVFKFIKDSYIAGGLVDLVKLAFAKLSTLGKIRAVLSFMANVVAAIFSNGAALVAKIYLALDGALNVKEKFDNIRHLSNALTLLHYQTAISQLNVAG